MTVKSAAKKVLRTLHLREPTAPWVEQQPNPADPDVLDSFGFYAIIATWMEGDVIASTVRNAFEQGCDRVYLIDNESPDDTVERATEAGAIAARSFATEEYDEPLRIRLMNETVAEVSRESEHDHVWWLWLDADEFVHGPGGMTLRETLAGLDRRFRIVGSRYFNHYPDRVPQYVPGFHPLDFQPMCEERVGNMCPGGHRKHHLQRYDREGPALLSNIGFHKAASATLLYEPTIHAVTHHFPYRDEAFTRERLCRLCDTDDSGASRVQKYDRLVWRNSRTASDMSKRFQTLDNVYARRWVDVDNTRRRGRTVGLELRPWADVAGPDKDHGPWYGRDRLDAAVAGRLDESSHEPTDAYSETATNPSS